jgi:acyl dehydratase
MKLFVGTMMSKANMMGSPGLEDLRWKKPVLAGETLSGKFTIKEKKPFKGNFGLVRAHNEMKNQDGKVVMEFTGLMLFAKKPT